MDDKNTSEKKIPRYAILIVISAVLILILAIIVIFLSRRAASDAALEPGRAYIRSLETADTSEIESQIRDIRREQMKTSMENGDLDVWQMLSDTVIFGDSRAEAFSEYEVMDSRHVVTTIGHSVKWFLEDLDTYKSALTSADPSSLVLVFGLNDVDKGMDVEEYIDEVIDVITQFQELLPDTTIYLNSIIPCNQHAIDKQPYYADIPAWNETVKAYCEEHDIPYIDITDTVEEHPDLYENDGIHMQKDFLDYWAMDIATEITEHEQQE